MPLDRSGSHLWPTAGEKSQPSTLGPGEREWRRHLVEVVILIDQLLQLALDVEYSFCWEFKFH